MKNINQEKDRNVYIDSLKDLFKNNKIEIFDKLGCCSLINDKLIIFATKEKYLNKILFLLSENNLTEINKINLKMLKSIFFSNQHGIKTIIISANNNYISISKNNLNVASDICFGFQEKNIDFFQYLDDASFIKLMEAFDASVIESLKINIDDYNLQKCINSQKEYVKQYLRCKKNPKRLFENRKRYNHIVKFSKIYFMYMKIISEQLDDINKKITIHDIGANISQFPLMLSSLSQKDLLGINIGNIIASDISWMDELNINKILQKNKNYRPIQFIQLDITDPAQNIPSSNVSILTDVLEHIKNEETAFNALKRVWEKTEDLLLVHLPFEEKVNPLWGHFIVYNQDIVKDWTSKIGGTYLLDEYNINKNETHCDGVYLIFKRKK